MGLFKNITVGLWWGIIFLIIMVLGEGFFPGSLAGTAFTELGILSVFAVCVVDMVFTLGSAE